MSFNGWIVKQRVVHPHHGILHSHKKEWTTDTCDNLDGSQGHSAELKKSASENSLVVQWLGLSAFTAEGPGSIPGRELRSRKPRSVAKKKKKGKRKSVPEG